MQERRKYVRDRVNTKVSLQHADLSGKTYDLSENGIGLRIPTRMQQSIPSVEVLRLFSKNKRTEPCQVEAELKWNSRMSNSTTLVGFEIRSLQTSSCRDIFDSLVHEQGSKKQPTSSR